MVPKNRFRARVRLRNQTLARAFAALTAFWLPCSTVVAQPASNGIVRQLDDSERKLVELCDEMKAALAKFYVDLNAIEEGAQRDAFWETKEPSGPFLDRLVEFERAHRGSDAGLMALRRLINHSGSMLNDASDRGRRSALKALPAYAAHPVLPEILRYVDARNPSDAEACLRAIIDSESVSKPNRAFAELALARLALQARDGRQTCQERLTDLDGGAVPAYPEERDLLLAAIDRMPAQARIDALEREAVEILESLAKNAAEICQPAIAFRDEGRYFIAVDAANSAEMPTAAELAEGTLFQELHLRVGRQAPDLDLTLIDGKRWSLAANRGKTVIVQFSFKGCGPCERMYPELGALKQTFADKLSIVTIMADEERADALASSESGMVTWDVAWDGSRGPIATQWAVQGFPTVYVIDPKGVVAVANDLRGEALSEKVAELAR